MLSPTPSHLPPHPGASCGPLDVRPSDIAAIRNSFYAGQANARRHGRTTWNHEDRAVAFAFLSDNTRQD